MTPLRQKMIEAMQVRGFSVRTHHSYLSAVADLGRYYHRSPDQLAGEQLQAFFVYLAAVRGFLPVIFKCDPVFLSPGPGTRILRRHPGGGKACATHSRVADAR